MTTLMTLLLAATMNNAPLAYVENSNSSGISYVCYFENENLMLARFEEGQSVIRTKKTDTGISTNDIDKVTMTLENNLVNITVFYLTKEPISAYFSTNDLVMHQIGILEPTLFAAVPAGLN